MSHNHLLPTEAERARIHALLKKIRFPSLSASDVSSVPYLQLSDATVKSLIADIVSEQDRKWKERIVSAWVLGVIELPKEDRSYAVGVLRKLLGNRIEKKFSLLRKRCLSAYRKVIGWLFCFLIISVIVGIWKVLGFGEIGEGAIMLFGAVTLAVIGSTPALMLFRSMKTQAYTNEARAMAAKSLLRQNALEAMPELLDGAMNYSPAIKEECRTALCHFLPRITEENRNVMPLNSEELIGKILNSTWDVSLSEALLGYLEKFGQGSSAKAIDYFVDRITHCGEDADIKFEEKHIHRYRRILALLRERQNRDYERQELLRHSSVPSTQADQLLRPATDSQTTPAEQLLRASNAEP